MPTLIHAKIDKAYELSENDLGKFFSSMTWYKGDPKRSAQLVRQFLSGIEWVRDELARKGILYSMPEIHFLKGYKETDYKIDARAFYDEEDGRIFIDSVQLADASIISFDQIIHEVNEKMERLFCGTIYDLYFLTGVHEADHERFSKQHGSHSSLSSDEVDTQTYDAQQHEIEALELEIKAAIEKKLPAVTIFVLQKRINIVRLMQDKTND